MTQIYHAIPSGAYEKKKSDNIDVSISQKIMSARKVRISREFLYYRDMIPRKFSLALGGG
jgi:hypothetical protein